MDRVHTACPYLVMAFALQSLVALGCGGSDGSAGGGTGGRITLDGGPPPGCLALGVPAEEPHLTGAPTFAEEFVFPTLPVEAEVGTSVTCTNADMSATATVTLTGVELTTDLGIGETCTGNASWHRLSSYWD